MRGHDLSNRIARLERWVDYLLQFAPKSLTAAAGAFALTGSSASLIAGSFLTAGTGAFALTGQTATLRRSLVASAAAGGFALTGQSVTLKKGLFLTASAGSFSLTGSAAALNRNRRVTAAAGSYALTGQAATLTLGAPDPRGLWDASDLSTLFQDSAGSTPVTTDNQPVGRWADLSGNGFNFLQSTSGLRMTYQTAGGLHWLESDGSDDEMVATGWTRTGSQTSHMFVVATIPGTLAANDGLLTYNLFTAANASRIIGFDNATTFKVDTVGSAAMPTFSGSTHVFEGLFDASGIHAAIDGGAYTDNATVPNTTSASLYLGKGVLGGRKAWKIHAVAVYDEELTGTARSDLVTWLGAKAGLTL